MTRSISKRVAIIGQGYVGLPLALAAAKSGLNVTGIDSNEELVEGIRGGKSHLKEVSKEYLSSVRDNYRVTSDIRESISADIVIFCLPTPLDARGLPNPSTLISVADSLAEYLDKNTLIINESTVSPGFTRETLGRIFTGRQLAFSPERIDPGNLNWNIENTPKLLAANSDEALTRAYAFYSHFIKSVTLFSSIEVVEAAKLLENTFRFINISFVNEFSVFCNKMGIDVQEVITAASLKPYGFMPFYPSAGIGGHCIPVDPQYLALKANEIGTPLRFIELATTVNNSRPSFFVEIAEEKLRGVLNKKILIVGLAYKPNVPDLRESPALKIIEILRSKGAIVCWHDEIIGKWNDESSCPVSKDFDLLMVVTLHDGVKVPSELSYKVLDTRGSTF
jgi:UDP-N-acetyl-D-glucosamine dehydrogenase